MRWLSYHAFIYLLPLKTFATLPTWQKNSSEGQNLGFLHQVNFIQMKPPKARPSNNYAFFIIVQFHLCLHVSNQPIKKARERYIQRICGGRHC
jgi:hypothetical protein